jgi:hypothetical protein
MKKCNKKATKKGIHKYPLKNGENPEQAEFLSSLSVSFSRKIVDLKSKLIGNVVYNFLEEYKLLEFQFGQLRKMFPSFFRNDFTDIDLELPDLLSPLFSFFLCEDDFVFACSHVFLLV